MKHMKFAIPLLMSFSLLGGGNQNSVNIQGTCLNGGLFPNCITGGIEFTSDNTAPNRVRIIIKDVDSGLVVADDVFNSVDGVLDFIEGFDAGTFDVQIKHGGNINGGTILFETTVVASLPTA
jgi:hypothetical protein